MADEPNPPAPPAPPDPSAGDPPPDPALGDAGKAALASERAARRAAEGLARKATEDLEAQRKTSQTDTERAVAEARAEIRAEVLADANARLLRSEIRAAAGDKLADPQDAVALLGDLSVFVDKNGEPDTRAIESAIDKLVKLKPYLGKSGTRPGALPGGGAKPSTGFSLNDEIRRQAGRT